MDISALKDLAISDSGFIFDPNSGQTFTVNPTGLAILRQLATGVPPSDLAGILCSQFECSPKDDPGRDVLDFLGMLKEAGFVR